MNKSKALLLLATFGVLATVPSVKADEWNQKTVFTFSGPVEVPGQVLPQGTYVFKLLDSPSNRHIVQVFNQDETKIFGTFLAIPDYRLKPSDKPLISFEERPVDSPEAIKAWFYPGRNYGHEFVYPKPRAVALAQQNNIPVPAMPAELAENTTKPAPTLGAPAVVAMTAAPLKAEKPTQEEVEVAEVFAVTADQADELPATASWMPLLGLAGLFSFATAGMLRLAAARAK